MAEKQNDPATQRQNDSGESLIRELIAEFRASNISDAEAARRRQRAATQRQLEADDEARKKAGQVDVVALTGFMLEGDDQPGGRREVRPGEELTISAFDLDGWRGKVRLKSLDADAGTRRRSGVTVTNG